MGKGFTLVELAIVLVIIGLLVGGVLAGLELIEQAKQNKIISSMREHLSSITTFKAKYGKMPGDFNKAASFFTGSANGTGDGQINYGGSEPWYAWDHLSKAGLAKGSFTGVYYTDCTWGTLCNHPGENVPKGIKPNDIWSLFYVGPGSVTNWSGKNKGRHILIYSAIIDDIFGAGAYQGLWNHSALKPEQQYRIDLKIDDGMPFTGKLVDMSGAPYSVGCTSSPLYTDTTATYSLSYDIVSCIMMIDAD